MVDKQDVLVSVAMITYNHEQYIAEAIESIVSQKTDFRFELIIGEDCSTDNTRNICLEYKEKYPDIIRLMLPERNIGMMPNWIQTIEAGQGKYIAKCDGDDYWTDPYKLQKQVDFMEQHPDFSLSAHAAYILMIGHFDESIINKTELTTTDLIDEEWSLMTASMLFRKDAWTVPDWYPRVINGDYGLQLLLSLKGRINYIPEIMCVYRMHLAGVSSSLKPLNQTAWMAFLLNEFNDYTSGKFYKIIKKRMKRMYKAQIYYAKGYGRRKQAAVLMFFRRLLFVNPFMVKVTRNWKL